MMQTVYCTSMCMCKRSCSFHSLFPPIPSSPNPLPATPPSVLTRTQEQKQLCLERSSTRARAGAPAGLHNRVIRTDCVRLLESELDSEMQECKCKLKEKERERERECNAMLWYFRAWVMLLSLLSCFVKMFTSHCIEVRRNRMLGDR